MLVLLYLCGLLILLYCIYWWVHRDLWIHGESFPGDMWLPLLGNLYLYSTDQVKNFKVMTNSIKKYGDTYRTWTGPFQLYVVLSNPDDIKMVLGNPSITDHDYVLSKGVAVCKTVAALNGEDWKRRRKLLAPTFNRQILHTFVETFGTKAQYLTEKLYQMPEGSKIDAYHYFGMCTMDGVSETIIGVKGNCLESDNCIIIDFVYGINKVLTQVLRYPWMLLECVFRRTEDGKKGLILAQKLYDMSENVIQQKLEAFRQGVKRPDIITPSDKKINSFLDVMIEASETSESDLPLTTEELRDEVLIMLLAGTETTALTLAYLLVLIAIHKDVQDEVYEELESIFGDDDRKVTLEDMGRMTVLDRVIKESLRLFPVFAFTPRSIPKDVRLTNGKILPKGCSVLLFNYGLHRNEAIYKNADKFWPDRWLPENIPEDFNPYAYIPFSTGPRKCIGHYYAQLQMKTTLGEFLRKFRVTTHLTENDLVENLKFGFTLQVAESLGGLCVQVERRQPLNNNTYKC